MRAWVEKDTPLIDRPGYAGVWSYSWNDECYWYDVEGSEFVMVGLPWKKE